MAYDIKIKGVRELVREEDHEKAFQIKKKWNEYLTGKGNDCLVKIGSCECLLSDIALFNEVVTRVKNDNVVVDAQKEFLRGRKEFMQRGIQYRANHLDLFRLFYFGFTKKKSEEIEINGKPLEEYVKAVQMKFFTENPKRAICDPILWKPFIKASKCHKNVLSIVENHVQQDKYWSRRIDSEEYLPNESSIVKDHDRTGSMQMVGAI